MSVPEPRASSGRSCPVGAGPSVEIRAPGLPIDAGDGDLPRRISTPWHTPGIFRAQVPSGDRSRDDTIGRFRQPRDNRGLASIFPQTSRSGGPGNDWPRPSPGP